IPGGEDLSVMLRLVDVELPTVLRPEGVVLRLGGRWRTEDGRRVFVVNRVAPETETQTKPMRLVLFLTDGYVGNDMAIIDAVRNNAHTTRVFSFGIGNSVNRYLLDGMARAGRGEVEYVLLNADADEAVERFTRRVETPVLTDIELAFSEELQVVDLLPSPVAIPDLFDAKPLVIHGRYRAPAKGTVTIRGRTGAGAYERTVELELPEQQPEHDVIATVWARAKVEQVMAPHLKAIQENYAPEEVRREIIALGEQFQIMTQFTSFVAVEKSRLTIDGKPVLVAVPIEMPDGVSFEGVFGERDADEALSPVVTNCVFAQPQQAGVAQEGTQLGRRAKAPVVTEARMRPNRGATPLPGPPARPSTGGRGIDASKAPALNLSRGSRRDAPGKGGSGGFGGGGSPRSAGKSPSLPGARGLPAAPADAPTGAPAAGGEVMLDAARPAEPEAEELGAMLYETNGAPPADKYDAADRVTFSELKMALERYQATETAPGKDKREQLGLADDLKEAQALPQLARIPVVEEFFRKREPGSPAIDGRPVFAQHVALVIGARTEQGQLEEAAALAEDLATARPDYATGVKMRDTLTDDTLEPAEVKSRIATLAEQAAQDLAAARAEAQRRARLNRVLDPALRSTTEDRPRVTVLVTDVGAATNRALREAGLEIEAAAESLPIVVGRVELSNLEKLALLDEVRRVESTRMEVAGP
ncbi:MAG: vWA domain-containing protein, partial [Planctomycetota bacterium]